MGRRGVGDQNRPPGIAQLPGMGAKEVDGGFDQAQLIIRRQPPTVAEHVPDGSVRRDKGGSQLTLPVLVGQRSLALEEDNFGR